METHYRTTMPALCPYLVALLLSLPAFGNPYCVSGANWAANGTMVRLGMPSASWGYIWDELQTTNTAVMVRPCRYWLLVGSQHKIHGYHEATDTIDDATAFGQWVSNNRGKIWIIGNEPNLPSQDGLTQAQYTAMYHKYYTFISQRDPTARFAVGALSGDTVPGNVESGIHWWEGVLSMYRTNYGGAMPVDVWNFHCYAPPYQRDVEQYMSLYVNPFCEWVRTVDGDRYAGAEIWTTEFGIGFWHGALNARWVEPWMQRVCLRLEQSEVNRWFWFLGPWDSWDPSGSWQQTCLLDAQGRKTVLGERYSAMANSYPNASATPMPDPPELPAPEEFFDDFDDGDVSDWIDKAGPWIAEASAYRCNKPSVQTWWDYAALQPFRYTDVTIEASVKINTSPSPSNWVGLEVGRSQMFEGLNQSGWLVFLRQSGAVGLHSRPTGTVWEVPGVVANTQQYHTLRIDAGGWPRQYDVYVDGVRHIRYFDASGYSTEGLVTLRIGQTNSTYDNVRITNGSRIVPEAINGDLESDGLLPWVTWQGPQSGQATIIQAPGYGTGGSRGVRIQSPAAVGLFDAGLRRAIAGARPAQRYGVEAFVRTDRAVADDPKTRIGVGIDPTGQLANADAATIQWATLLPFGADGFVRLRTGYVRPTGHRLSVWVRVGNTAPSRVWADIDNIALLGPATADGNSLIMAD